jgi:hypothetical protein
VRCQHGAGPLGERLAFLGFRFLIGEALPEQLAHVGVLALQQRGRVVPWRARRRLFAA